MEKAKPLLVVVIGMAVLIFLVTTVVVVKLIKDFATGPAAPAVMTDATLRQPLGSHIVTITTIGSRIAVLVTGGGPDRVLVVDPADGRITGQLQLGQ